MSSKKIAVIGAGPMGLACAYELLKTGHLVDLYERDDRRGGMSAAFDFDGLMIERYYHFICRPDVHYFELLKELNIADKLRWRQTKMGFFYQGVLYPWGSPLHLLTFPKLDFISKLRYALHVLYTKSINHWEKLDQVNAIPWLKTWLGEKAYQQLWDYLFELKFYEYKESISAAWIGTRIKRVALSRKNLFTEQLGYLEGGSETLLKALAERILVMQGKIYLKTGIERLATENQQVQGVVVNGTTHHYDSVVSTMPLPYIQFLAPDLPEAIFQKIKAIKNAGVACVILKLRSPLTENFWLNINDPEMAIPGLIEYSNLYPMPYSIVYVPFYMPKTHPKYANDNASFIKEVLDYLPRLNPAFAKDWVMATHVSRYEFAQPICTPHFYQQLPPMQTPIQGFFMADTSYYYPEDRSISESVKVGKKLAELVSSYLNRNLRN
jgi:protoporphyrinogen oxidase